MSEYKFVKEIPKSVHAPRAPRKSKWAPMFEALKKQGPGTIVDIPCRSSGYAHSVATNMRTGKVKEIDPKEIAVKVVHLEDGSTHLFIELINPQ